MAQRNIWKTILRDNESIGAPEEAVSVGVSGDEVFLQFGTYTETDKGFKFKAVSKEIALDPDALILAIGAVEFRG